MTTARTIRNAGTLLLGLVIWPFLLPLGLKRIARKAAKPVALWLTHSALRHSMAEIGRLSEMRADLVKLERIEQRRGVELVERLNRISTW